MNAITQIASELPKRKTGTRSLAALAKNASTSRMLNLGLIHQRHHEEPAHTQYPFFQNRFLNQCILLKHRVRPDERGLFKEYPPVSTKLLFPFDWSDLALGGRSVLVGERGFRQKLSAVVGQGDAIPEADWAMLQLVDSLPSLDPFLLREQLRRSRRHIADCYYQLSASDSERMHNFVATQLYALIELAFDLRNKGAKEFVSRIVDALLSVEGGERLEPLRMTLGLNPDEFREGVFCWKGFLYYKWAAQDHEMAIEQLLRDFKRLKVRGAPHAQADMEFKILLGQIKDSVEDERKSVRMALRVYDDAFDELVVNRKPVAFKKFLKDAPYMFIEIGDKLGILTHMSSFWKYQFPEGTPPVMIYPEAVDLFREFESGFARDLTKAIVWD